MSYADTVAMHLEQAYGLLDLRLCFIPPPHWLHWALPSLQLHRCPPPWLAGFTRKLHLNHASLWSSTAVSPWVVGSLALSGSPPPTAPPQLVIPWFRLAYPPELHHGSSQPDMIFIMAPFWVSPMFVSSMAPSSIVSSLALSSIISFMVFPSVSHTPLFYVFYVLYGH